VNDDRDSLRAAATVIRSQRARTIAAWALASVVLPCAGWISAKLDTKDQVQDLRNDFKALSGDVIVLTSQQRDLVSKITDLTSQDLDRPGPIFVIRRELRFAGRATVRATTIALAHETQARRAQKLAAADLLAGAYDNRAKDEQPSAALQEVFSTVAVP